MGSSNRRTAAHAAGGSLIVAGELALLDLLRDRTTGPPGQEDPRPLRDINDLHDADYDAVLADHLPPLPAATGTSAR